MIFSLTLFLLLPSTVYAYNPFNFSGKPKENGHGPGVDESLSRNYAAGPREENNLIHPSDHSLLPPTESTLSAGLFHTCAITYRAGVECGSEKCGPVKCWGHNDRGQATPPPGAMFQQVSSGGFFTCGIKLGGKVACWGEIDHPPRSLELLSKEELSNFKHARRMQQEAAGNVHSSTPPVNGGGYYLRVSSGMKHACGIARNLEVHCWGRNDFGESQPPKGTFVQVSAGNSFTCGIRPNGAVQCWGKNDIGQSAPPSYPEYVFQQISTSVGGDHACGILMDRSLRSPTDIQCWGNNGRGQSEKQDGAVGKFLQVSAGARTTCAIIEKENSASNGDDAGLTNDVHCWGGRANALLGHFAATKDKFYQQIQIGQDHACTLGSLLAGNKMVESLQCWWMVGSDFGAHRVPVGLEMV